MIEKMANIKVNDINVHTKIVVEFNDDFVIYAQYGTWYLTDPVEPARDIG